MSLPYYCVASFGKRAVYKTEFDIFKKSTDIDLISLISYDEEPPENYGYHKRLNNSYKYNKRPVTVPESGKRQVVRANVKSAKNASSASRYSYRRQVAKSAAEISSRRLNDKPRCNDNKRVAKSAATITRNGSETQRDFTKTSKSRPKATTENQKGVTERDRLCQSACDLHDNSETVTEPARSKTTCGFSQNNKLNTNNSRKGKRKKRKRHSPNDTASGLVCGETKQKVVSVSKSWQIQNSELDIHIAELYGEEKGNVNDTNPIRRVSCTGPAGKATLESVGSADTNPIRDREVGNADTNVELRQHKRSSLSWTREESSENKRSHTTDEKGRCIEVCESHDSGISSYTAAPDTDDNPKPCEPDVTDDISEKHVTFDVLNANKEDFEDSCGSDNSKSDSDGIYDVSNNTNNTECQAFDSSNLLSDFERFGAQSRNSTTSFLADADTNSLISHQEEKRQRSFAQLSQKTKGSIRDIAMSKEARHAILETLNDMGGERKRKGGKENKSQNIHHKSVNAHRKMKENRNKYDCVMRERSRSFLRSQFQSMDSLGNDENSSQYSSPIPVKEYDDASSEELERAKLFPAIRENTRLSRVTVQSHSKTNVYSLEQAKTKNYKIPGIGNYKFMATPDDFEITPPGFDSRYNQRPIISKEELEIPPLFVRERSIQKCQNWLSNVSLSPMSLKPARNPRKPDT